MRVMFWTRHIPIIKALVSIFQLYLPAKIE
jgi:hypothetical protein